MQQAKLSLNLSYAVLIFVLVSIFAAGSFYGSDLFSSNNQKNREIIKTFQGSYTTGKIVSITKSGSSLKSLKIDYKQGETVIINADKDTTIYKQLTNPIKSKTENTTIDALKKDTWVTISFKLDNSGNATATKIGILVTNIVGGEIASFDSSMIKLGDKEVRLTTETNYYKQIFENGKSTSEPKQITFEELNTGIQATAYLSSTTDDSNSTAETIMIMEIK